MKKYKTFYIKMTFFIVALSIILVLNACSYMNKKSNSSLNEPTDIAIELKEGFSGEAIKIFAEDKEMYSNSPITRDVGWGYIADRVTYIASKSKTTLNFVIPGKKLDQTYNLDVSKGKLLAVSIKDNKFEFFQPNFFVDMQSGFHDNTVQVLVNGRELFNKKITTDAIIGMAGSTYMKLTDTKVKLTVKVQDLKIEKEFDIDIEKGTYIGINRNNKELLITQNKSSFLYL